MVVDCAEGVMVWGQVGGGEEAVGELETGKGVLWGGV